MKCEACVGSVAEARRAIQLCADRVELCADLSQAGLTPSYAELLDAAELKGCINVIIRPTATFMPSSSEFELMKQQIADVASLGFKGVVFGVLDANGNVDLDRNRELCVCAGKLEKTFHMAFDEVCDQFKALQELIDLGFDAVLTKGGAGRAEDNTSHLRDLVAAAAGRIVVMAGGSVTLENREQIARETGCEWLHGRRIVGNLDS